MNVPIISEDDFLKMIGTRKAAQGLSSPAAKKGPTTPKSVHKATTSKNIKSEPEPLITSVATPTKKRSPETNKIDSKPKASSSTTPSKKVEADRKQSDESEGKGEVKLPWVDKYKPTNLKQVIGKKKKTERHFEKYLCFFTLELQECTETGALLKNCFTG